MTLTDEQLNIAICEWRGWKSERDESGWWNISPEGKRVPALHGSSHGHPSHITGPTALGNMHEAEKGLTNEQILIYLAFLTKKDQDRLTKTFWPAVSATARQRGIALLRVVKPELFQ